MYWWDYPLEPNILTSDDMIAISVSLYDKLVHCNNYSLSPFRLY